MISANSGHIFQIQIGYYLHESNTEVACIFKGNCLHHCKFTNTNRELLWLVVREFNIIQPTVTKQMTTQKLWTNALNDISVAMLVITQRNSFTSSIIRISGQYNDYSTILIFLFMILYGSLPQWLTSSKLYLSPDAQDFRMQATGILKNLSVTLMLKQEWGKKTPYPKNISNMLGTWLETW